MGVVVVSDDDSAVVVSSSFETSYSSFRILSRFLAVTADRITVSSDVNSTGETFSTYETEYDTRVHNTKSAAAANAGDWR